MKREKPFWIKQRYNPQLGIYYVPCGQLSKTKAKKMENSLYGSNVMHSYPDEKTYQEALVEIQKKEGK
jgi:hypothetical protein